MGFIPNLFMICLGLERRRFGHRRWEQRRRRLLLMSLSMTERWVWGRVGSASSLFEISMDFMSLEENEMIVILGGTSGYSFFCL